MAIIEALPGLKVTIESQGRALEEYKDDSEWIDEKYTTAADKKTSVYVECVSDATFQIAFSVEPPFKLPDSELTFRVSVDGQRVGGTTARSLPGGRHSSFVSESRSRINADEVSHRELKFTSIRKGITLPKPHPEESNVARLDATVNIDDADSNRVKNDAKLASGIGEIVVYAYRSRHEKQAGRNRPTRALNGAPSEISEKALKGRALSHGVGFGEERRERCRKQSTLIHIDGKLNPIAIFKFKYRSREALQQEMIIPRSPSPDVVISPLNSRSYNNDNTQSLSRDERLAKLKREIDLIKSEVKAEDGENPQSRRGQKRSRNGGESSSGRAYKTSRNDAGSVVVDLTGD